MIGKQKSKSSSEPGTILTLLGRDTAIEGNLTFKETIRIDGQVSGKLISVEGTVIIGEQAVVEADVQVGVAIIRGKINGRVEASQRIEIHAPAQVSGDITAPTVTIGSGVVFNGHCRMQTAPPQTVQSSTSAGKESPPANADALKGSKKL